TFRGGRGWITSRNNLYTFSSNSVYGPYEVLTRAHITDTKGQVINAINNFPVRGLTPTASGLHQALQDYNAHKGDTSNRQTIFVLITDGVANARHEKGVRIGNTTYHGYVKMRTNSGSFNEADQEYDKTLEEVAEMAQKIRDEGYTLITGYWEDYNFQVGRYGQRYNGSPSQNGYYPIRPKVLATLEEMSDTFVIASTLNEENIDDFVELLTESIE